MAGLVDFQDEEQVKSFLENMEVECHYQCYREKDPEGCYRLVDYLEGIQKNFDEAAKVLKFNCEKYGHGDSCYKLGAYYVTGKGGLTQDLKAASSCFLMACEKPGKKSVESCHNVGLLAHDGQGAPGFPKDMGLACKYSMKACDLGHVWACANASRMYKLGDGVDKDEAKAEVLKNRARQLHKEQQKNVQPLTFG